MLEGQIEFSIIKFSELDPIKFRADAEFYQQRHLQLDEKLRKLGCIFLKDIGAKLDCSAFYPSITDEYNFDGEGIPFLRVNEIQNGLVKTTSSTAFLPQHVLDKNPSTISTAYPFDIVIAKGGNSLAKLGLLPTDFPKYALSRDLIAVCTSDLKINKYFVWLFLHSAYGQSILWRTASQTGQPHLTLPSIEQLAIPKYSKEFEATAETLYMQSERLKNKSNEAYRQAEMLLLETLGMADFLPDTETVNIKSFKDSFAATGRLDAEYYQPKYEEVVAHITAQAHDTLSALVTIKKSIEPGSDEYAEDEQGLPFLRVADYSKFGMTPPQKKLRPAFVAANQEALKALKPKAGTILFSKDGSVGEAYCLREDGGFITSGAILHLTVRDTKKVLPDYLTLALNSALVKMQAERDAGGSIILHWRVGEIENVIVPLVDMPTQQKIATLIQESFALKVESERLLEVAKRAVEMAIEQDEAAAMAYLARA